MAGKPSILLVDDDERLRNAAGRVLRCRGPPYRQRQFRTGSLGFAEGTGRRARGERTPNSEHQERRVRPQLPRKQAELVCAACRPATVLLFKIHLVAVNVAVELALDFVVRFVDDGLH